MDDFFGENSYFSAAMRTFNNHCKELYDLKETVEQMEADLRNLFYTPIRRLIENTAQKVSGTPCLEVKIVNGELETVYYLYLGEESHGTIWIRRNDEDVYIRHHQIPVEILILLATKISQLEYRAEVCTESDMEALYHRKTT